MPAPERRLYKHVNFKKQSGNKTAGWIAQVMVDGKQKAVGGLHNTQQQAAATAARVMKVPLQDLRLPPPVRCREPRAADSSTAQQSSSPQAGRKMKGVKKVPLLKKYVYKQGNRFRVVVGTIYVGSFATAAEAGAAATHYAQQHGLAKELRDQKGVKPGELLERLKAGLKVFHGYEPPDLENLAEEIKLCSSLWQSEPALAFLCALGKYGPWRANLRARAQTWFSKGKPPARLQDLPSRTAGLLHILKGTVEDMQSTAWHLASSTTAVYLEFRASHSC